MAKTSKTPKRNKNYKISVLMQKKLLGFFLFVVACLLVLAGRVIYINAKYGADYAKAVYNNVYTKNSDTKILAARRGSITDRNGTILAYSTKVYNLILDSKVLLANRDKNRPENDEKDNVEYTIEALVEEFGIDEFTLREHIEENQALKDKGETPSSYKRLAMGLTKEEIAGIKEKISAKKSRIFGVWFEEGYSRNYPYDSLGCDVIGFANAANQGQVGLEQYYNDYLSGSEGRSQVYVETNNLDTVIKPAVNGNNIVTTIDYNIQGIIEKAIADFNEKYGSTNTSVLVMDPNNAEILAMADYPSFNLNDPSEVEKYIDPSDYESYPKEKIEDRKSQLKYDIWTPYSIKEMFEPGSVFKTFTIAEAIDEKISNQKDIYECDGKGVYDGSTILCHGGNGHGKLTLAGTLAESCNDGLMQLSEKIGVQTFSKYIGVFNLCQLTGIDLPYEKEGIRIPEEKMMDVDLATNSFGQNINVTMVQMAAAFASVINGGNVYKPHIVSRIESESGDVIKKIEPQLVAQTISAETSKLMRNILRAVVDYGTGGYTRIDGYSIGGKTGTAEKADRDKSEYVISFMGFAPAEKPEVLVYVVIDAPKCVQYDSSWAAQILIKRIFRELLPYMEIERNNPEYDEEIYLDTDLKEPVTRIYDDEIMEQVLYNESLIDNLLEIPDEEIAGEPSHGEEETPAETPAEEVPAETPAEEVPVETPAEEVPIETPAEEVPIETPAEEVPVETPAEEVPAETPAEEVPAENPAELPPAEVVVE